MTTGREKFTDDQLPVLEHSTAYRSSSKERLRLNYRGQPSQSTTSPLTSPEDTVQQDHGYQLAKFNKMESQAPDDSIIHAIHRFIQDERRRSFHFLAAYSHQLMSQLDLLNVSHARHHEVAKILRNASHPSLSKYTAEDWYTFDPPQANGHSRTVAITRIHGETSDIKNLLVTSLHGRNKLLILSAPEWIRETYEWDDDGAMKFSETQYEEQWLWWTSNGKAFRFLDLPPELRQAIYLQAISPVVLPGIRDTQVTLGRGLSYRDPQRAGRNRDPDIDSPNMMFMQISRQIREEAISIAYKDTFKRLRHCGDEQVPRSRPLHFYGDYERSREPIRTMPSISDLVTYCSMHTHFLRRVQLEMSAAAYFASIGITPLFRRPFAKASGSFLLSSLSSFPALKYLDFRFIGPKHRDALCPWSSVFGTARHGEHSCQRVWIDWFFAFAWDILKDLNADKSIVFSLSGCVKTSRKQYWQKTLNDKDEDYSAEMATLRAEIEASKDEDGPEPCQCSTPCSRKDAESGHRAHMFPAEQVRAIEGLQEHLDDVYWRFAD
ncbi:hypothetical protein ACEQ8H_005704 [Pleosporales sp. CAS-2024a]